MRYTALAMTLTGTLLMTGCSSLVSLNPFVTDKEAQTDPALVGTWADGDGETMYIIRPSGAEYQITYVEKSSTTRFEARVWRAGSAELLDLVPKNEDAFQIPAHTIVRVWPKASTVEMAFLDADWLKKLAVEKLATQVIDSRTLITSPGEAVRTFLSTTAADDRAYEKKNLLHRLP